MIHNDMLKYAFSPENESIISLIIERAALVLFGN